LKNGSTDASANSTDTSARIASITTLCGMELFFVAIVAVILQRNSEEHGYDSSNRNPYTYGYRMANPYSGLLALGFQRMVSFE
jgi:hypothetical protein